MRVDADSSCRYEAKNLTKLCELYGDVIHWDESNRAYILTHGVSGVAWTHYKHLLHKLVGNGRHCAVFSKIFIHDIGTHVRGIIPSLLPTSAV